MATTTRTTLRYLADIGEPYELLTRPMAWQLKGLTWTATGYGARIPSRRMVRLDGRLYRVYITQYANAGSAWITRRGERLYLRDTD